MKKASFEKYQEEWKSDKPLRAALLSRSVQVFKSEKVTVTDGVRLNLKGGSGLACFVSSDGYALTATHVVDSPPHYILTNSRNETDRHLPYVARSKGLVMRIYDQNNKLKSEKRVPSIGYRFWNPEGPVNAGLEVTLKKVPVRIVYQWPQSDLALIKLPVSDRPHFTLAASPPALGEVLFAPGNPLNDAPRPSAGKLLKRSQREKSYRLMTSVPVAPGDSGGPAVDTRGNLVGVASRGYPAIGRHLPRFTKSSFFLSERAEIERLIEEDRRKN